MDEIRHNAFTINLIQCGPTTHHPNSKILTQRHQQSPRTTRNRINSITSRNPSKYYKPGNVSTMPSINSVTTFAKKRKTKSWRTRVSELLQHQNPFFCTSIEPEIKIRSLPIKSPYAADLIRRTCTKRNGWDDSNLIVWIIDELLLVERHYQIGSSCCDFSVDQIKWRNRAFEKQKERIF